MEAGGQFDTPTVLPTEINRVLFELGPGWPQTQCGRCREEKYLFHILGFEPRVVQPVA